MLLLALCMVLGFFPGSAILARASDSVSYLDADGKAQSTADAANITSLTDKT